MTEREKMLAGELYSAHDGELKAAHARAIKLCEKLNYGNLSDEEREEVTKQLLGKCGKNTVLGRGEKIGDLELYNPEYFIDSIL